MKTKTVNMTEGAPMRLILTFAAPMLFGNIFQQLYNFADTTIVGRFLGADALAAVGAPGTMISCMLCLCFGLTNGAGIIIAQCCGAKDFERLRVTVGSLICVISAIGAALMAAGLALAPALLRLINVPSEIISDASLYMRCVMLGVPFSMAYNGCSAVLRNMGDSKTPLAMLIISSAQNITLDLLFVAVLGFGIAGAAAATIIAQGTSALLCVIHIRHRSGELRLGGTRIRAEREAVTAIFKTGAPAALQSCMISLGTLSVQRLINSFGTQAAAAYTASTKIDSLAIAVVVTLGTALSIYSAQNIGAGRVERIRRGLYKTLAAALAYCALTAAVMTVFGGKILTIFLDPAEAGEAIAIGARYLKTIGAAYFMAGIMRCYLNVVHGAGDVNISMLTGIAELSVRVAASYALAGSLGLDGLWIAIPISWGAASLIPVIRYYSGRWKSKSLVRA